MEELKKTISVMHGLATRVLRESALGIRTRNRSLRAVHVAVRVDGDALAGHALRATLGGMRRDEGRYQVFGRVTDADSRQPAGVPGLVRLRIDRVQVVIAVDEEPADAAELLVRVDVLTALIED